MPTTNDIRATFLDYFAARQHQILPSSSLVPNNDPTLLFTNAGMVQFKNVFSGQESRPYTRATTAQKVVRAGGKHNDLDNVGYTARHHTFFEMMGNFSFGDYFKDTAIELAWTLVTRDFNLPVDRLLVTVFAEDDESASLWKKIAGLPESRIIRIPTSDNFWRMGDTGPCGPCSEIFYDHGEDVPGGPPGSPDEDGDRFVEIWNLVFMQFFEDPPGTRAPLPKPSIDTGLGLERFAAIMQGKRDNYDVDSIRALITASAEATGQDPDGPFKMSHRVVADHLRSTAFLIADGVLPTKEGRGYVLRRIMRRAMRHLHMMGTTEPLFYKLLPALIRQMGAAYPELVRTQSLISETMRLEEERFKSLLDRGLGMLAEELQKLPGNSPLPGDIAFRLYDTYGFPLDLTQDALREQGRGVDVPGFDAAMNEQRARARASWAGSGDTATESVWFELYDKHGDTEFLGYSAEKVEAEVQAIVKKGAPATEAVKGEEAALVLNQTPFYAEGGGQVGDKGKILTADAVMRVTDTQRKVGGLIVHYGVIEAGSLKVGQSVTAAIDHEHRKAVRANHSATHLLHAALHQRLGAHVTQKGSLNDAERLRFDVSHSGPIAPEDLMAIEAEVNARIRENTPVLTRVMSHDAALSAGAMALFNEKYGDEVRVVSMGPASDVSPQAWSTELCGGTHVNYTGDIGLFHIISESGVSAGVRRIEAVTGATAERLFREARQNMHEVASLLRVPASEAITRLKALLDERKTLARQITQLQLKASAGGASSPADDSEKINGVAFVTRQLEGISAKDMKGLADSIAKQLGSGVIALASAEDGKVSLIVALTPDMAERFDAVTLVRLGAGAIGGNGGGGRRTMAQAGGSEPRAIPEAFAAIRRALASA